MTAPDHEQAERSITQMYRDAETQIANLRLRIERDAARAAKRCREQRERAEKAEAQLAERERALLRLYQSWRHESGCMIFLPSGVCTCEPAEMPDFVREALAAHLAEAQKDAESLDRLLESLRLEWETEREELRAQLADERDRNKARIKREQNLKAQLGERERALREIADNAKAFHKGEDGKAAALQVIGRLAATHSDSDASE